ncbi:Glycosyl transferases group 1 [compost metagenome]
MHKLRVGVPIDRYDLHAGGAFSYATQLIAGINNHVFPNEIDIIFLDYTGKANIESNKEFLSFHPYENSSFSDYFRKALIEMLKRSGKIFFNKFYNSLERKHSKKRNEIIKKILVKNDIHVILYVKPDYVDVNFPFVTVHWDIGHRSTYMFPEFAESFESREAYYHKVLNRALYILTETQAGKNELINFTSINADRIGVMPIFPGGIINENVPIDTQKNILTRFNISENKFFIYPAQFWAHKNHIALIDAMREIIKLHPDVKLILTGSDKGNLGYIKDCIKEKNLNKNIQIVGFVSNEELFTFYKNAIALVMPTFLGPSNMPPLEAAFLDCPVILSDLNGHRELMKDYATYFDPTDVSDLHNKMLEHINSNKTETFNNSYFTIKNSVIALEAALLKLKPVRFTWGH